jgi:exodeoxyribonuclease VII small subunit
MPSKKTKDDIDDIVDKDDEVDQDVSYQELRSRLDELLLKLQDPDCDVDEAVDMYEQALTIITKLEQRLEAAENRITKIQAQFGGSA